MISLLVSYVYSIRCGIPSANNDIVIATQATTTSTTKFYYENINHSK